MTLYIIYTLFITGILFGLFILINTIYGPLLKGFDNRNILPIFFFILLFSGFAYTFIDVQTISENENRNLEKWSPIKREGVINAPKQIDTYVNDHFGFRETMIGIYRYIQFNVFNQSISKSVLLGSDGFLFAQDVVHRNYVKPSLSLKEIKSTGIIQKLKDLNNYLHARGVKLEIIVCPSKASIYPENLPNWIDTEKYGRATINNFTTLIKEETNIPILDLYNELNLVKSTEKNILYFKTDSHWNGVGAYHATKIILPFLLEQNIKVREINFNNFTEKEDFLIGDMSRSLGIEISDNCNQYILNNPLLKRQEISSNSVKSLGITMKNSPWRRISVHYSKNNKNKNNDVPYIIADSYILSSRFTPNIPFNKYYSMHYAYISKGLNPLLKQQKDIDIVILSFVDRKFESFINSILEWEYDSNDNISIDWK